VPIDEQRFEYVGFWARVLASVVDLLLSALLLTPLLNALYHRPAPSGIGTLLRSPEAASGLLIDALTPHGTMDVVLDYLVPAAVVLAFWLARQATPGKMLIHARIVDAETMAKPSAGRLLVRYLGYYVGFFSLGLGFVWVAFDRRKQGWHDKLAGTVVVRERRDGR
jgi:uncharacterized RDD family membrane protein YckC